MCLVACAGRRLTAGTRGRSANRDPPESPGSSLHNDPPWWDSQGLGSPAPRSLGRRLRGARPRPLRVGSTRGPTTASCDRACPCLGAWRGQDDGSACSRGPRDGCGQGPAWGCTERRVRRWPSRGRRPCCRARAGRGRLCDQGRPCCRTRSRERGSGATRVSMAARSTPSRCSATHSPTPTGPGRASSCSDVRGRDDRRLRAGVRTQHANTDQQMSFRNRWSSSTSSRIASGS